MFLINEGIKSYIFYCFFFSFFISMVINYPGMQELNDQNMMSPAGVGKVMITGSDQTDTEEGSNNVHHKFPMGASPYTYPKKGDVAGGEVGDQKKHQMPPPSVMTRLILIMVWRKLIRNPNTYSSLFGLVWSLISFK